MTVLGLLVFALIGGAALFLKFRSWCAEDLWLHYSHIVKMEKLNTREALPRPKPAQWDYSRGIPPWNPAMLIAIGVDPRTHYFTRQ